MLKLKQRLTRRKFLHNTAIAFGSASVAPWFVPGEVLGKNGKVAPSNRVTIGMIGMGRQAIYANTNPFLHSKDCQVVAVCDVDKWRLDNAKKKVDDFYKNSDCKAYTDWREVIARDYYIEARAAWESGKYLKAVQLLNKALTYDPKQTEWNETLLKLDRVSKLYPQAAGDEKESQLIRRGVSYYLLGDTETMLNSLRYLISLDPTNRSADELLRVIKKVHNITAPEVGTTKGMSLVEEKLYKCLNYFYDGKYNLVIKEAQEVLALEPDNPVAYKRIGSAYFAIGDKKKAAESWRKSLEMNPSDEDLRDYIIRVEKEIGK